MQLDMYQRVAECPNSMTGLNVYGMIDLPGSVSTLQQAGYNAQLIDYQSGFGQMLIDSRYDRDIAIWLQTVPGVRVEMVASAGVRGHKR